MKMLAVSVLLVALMGRTMVHGRCEHESEGPKVMFSAVADKGNRNIGPFPKDTTLIYNKVITNIGNAYSPSTGVFTAPYKGVYYFSFFYHAGGGHQGKLHLLKNSNLKVMTHDHKSSTDKADNGGNAVFLELVEKDQVYVRLVANSHVWGSGYHTTFNGFLVTPM